MQSNLRIIDSIFEISSNISNFFSNFLEILGFLNIFFENFNFLDIFWWKFSYFLRFCWIFVDFFGLWKFYPKFRVLVDFWMRIFCMFRNPGISCGSFYRIIWILDSKQLWSESDYIKRLLLYIVRIWIIASLEAFK